MLNISKLFDDAWDFAIKHGAGPQARVAWARAPKKRATERVTRHFMKHQRQLQNAKSSGHGLQERARRIRQMEKNNESNR